MEQPKKFMSGEGEDSPQIRDFLETIPKHEKKNTRIMDLDPKYFKSEDIAEVTLEFYEYKGGTYVDISVYKKDHPDTPSRVNSFNLGGIDTFAEFLAYTTLGSVLFEGADSYAERKVLSRQLEDYISEKSKLEKK